MAFVPLSVFFFFFSNSLHLKKVQNKSEPEKTKQKKCPKFLFLSSKSLLVSSSLYQPSSVPSFQNSFCARLNQASSPPRSCPSATRSQRVSSSGRVCYISSPRAHPNLHRSTSSEAPTRVRRRRITPTWRGNRPALDLPGQLQP